MQTENIRNQGKREREVGLRRARKRRRSLSVAGAGLAVFGGFVLLVAAMYGGVSLYEKLAEQRGDTQQTLTEGEQPEQEIQEAVSGAVVYSQEELDEQISSAVAQAQGAEAERVLEGIKEALSGGTTTVETLRPYYPDDIVVVSGGRFHFVPINRELKQSQLDAANLNILENGEYQYLTDGQVTSHKGIDVSSHQGEIDWGQVAQDGVEFAIIRLGYRGYGSEGTLMEDKRFEDNIRGASAAGIKVGVYFFSQAITQEELLEEANLVLTKIAPYRIDCPVVYDVEKTSKSGRMNNISVEERTQLTELFCRTIADAGYRPMIYHNTEMGALMIDVAQLEEYDKWYASYSDQMFYPYEYKIWQYSDTGKIAGISTDVDLNICFEPIWK